MLKWLHLRNSTTTRGAPSGRVLARRRYAALQYLLSRLDNMASIGDPAHDLLPQVAMELEVQIDLPHASREIRELLSNDTCYSLERLLTGEPWVDDRGKLVGS